MTDPELFIVRVWRQLAGAFHASVRRVDGDETHHFSQPGEVARFLVEPAAPADQAGAAPRPVPSPPTAP